MLDSLPNGSHALPVASREFLLPEEVAMRSKTSRPASSAAGQDPGLRNRVQAYRSARNWSQEELALRTGLFRAGISAIEIGRLVPSTSAALGLARAFGCTVEDLFELEASLDCSPDWAWEPPQDSCRYWLAEVRGRRWLYPVEMSQVGLAVHDGVWQAGELRTREAHDPSQTLIKVVRSVDYRRQLAELPGYAVTGAGEIQHVD